MRTFHTGGIAGEDITAGLPRVVELFEARHPKAEAVLADIDGHVTLEEAESDRMIKVVITSGDGTESAEYIVERQLLRPQFVEGAEVRANTRSPKARCTRTRSSRTTCGTSAARPRRSVTWSRRCRRSTGRRAWISTTSTSR